jgi:hypothetical protein
MGHLHRSQERSLRPGPLYSALEDFLRDIVSRWADKVVAALSTGPVNESAVSLAWLLRLLSNPEVGRISDFESAPNTALEQWRAVSSEMRGEPGTWSADNWNVNSDIWLCKSQTIVDGKLRAIWSPPENIDDFPLSSVHPGALARWGARGTRSATLDALIVEQPPRALELIEYRRRSAVERYRKLYKVTTSPYTDPAIWPLIVMQNQILSWVGMAFGVYLRGLLLELAHTPQELDELGNTTVDRVANLVGFKNDEPFMQWTLVGMHNLTFTGDGSFSPLPTRAGQSELWRERWGWVTQCCTPDNALSALATAAQLVASIAVVSPLITLAKGNSRSAVMVALCTLRRLLLTLRAMAWAEEALRNKWRLVRPVDLLCFACSALRPHWPRPAIALSHRSRTVKPLLFHTRFWDSPFSMVDATYIPQWETNIAMIWGLFAPTPTIIRMPSAAYLESEWCQRESELLEYVTNQCDFMRNRSLIDAEESAAANLDSLLDQPLHERKLQQRTVRSILVPELTQAQAVRMSAAGAIRVIAAATGLTDEDVARVARMLRHGDIPQFDCPTNNKLGWREYVDIFQELAQIVSMDEEARPLDEGSARIGGIRGLIKNLPDFGDPGVPPLRDHLAAFEWMLVEQGNLLPEQNYASIAVDCRSLTREEWESSPAYTLHRGLTSAATGIPVWFMQSANQRIDKWPRIGDYRPIFTQLLEGQFRWMELVSLPGDWFERYAAKSDVRW